MNHYNLHVEFVQRYKKHLPCLLATGAVLQSLSLTFGALKCSILKAAFNTGCYYLMMALLVTYSLSTTDWKWGINTQEQIYDLVSRYGNRKFEYQASRIGNTVATESHLYLGRARLESQLTWPGFYTTFMQMPVHRCSTWTRGMTYFLRHF
jgi:hypothetical protein